MLKKDDLSYFIKHLYEESSELIPPVHRVKLSKQVAEIFLEVGDFSKAQQIMSEILDSDEYEKLPYELKYEVLNTLYRIHYKQGDYQKAKELLEQMLSLVNQQKDESRKCSVLVKFGNIYTGESEYSKSIEYYSKAIEIGEKIDQKKCLATAYNNLAVYYAAVERKYDEALIQFQKALSLYETVKPGSSITSGIMVNMGSVFKHKKMFEKALDYYQRAHTIARKLHKYDILAHIYKEKAEIYYELGEFDISKVFAERALTVYATVDGRESRRWIAETNVLLGKILNQQDASFSEISSKFQEATQIFMEFNDYKNLIDTYNVWADIALLRGLQSEARKLLNEALKLASEHGLTDEEKELKRKLEFL